MLQKSEKLRNGNALNQVEENHHPQSIIYLPFVQCYLKCVIKGVLHFFKNVWEEHKIHEGWRCMEHSKTVFQQGCKRSYYFFELKHILNLSILMFPLYYQYWGHLVYCSHFFSGKQLSLVIGITHYLNIRHSIL